MKLPNIHAATIPEAKLVDYLLSPTHHRGKSKAAFFTRLGFSREHWAQLGEALLQHARDNKIAAQEETLLGTRYIIDGMLHSPSGESLQVRVAWFIDKGKQLPRFITAYPLKRPKP